MTTCAHTGVLAQAVVPALPAILLAAVGMVLTAGYVLAIQRDDVPASRRRIRTASGVLLMMLMGLLAWASGVVPVADRRLFVLAWLLVVIVLGAVIALALADIFNNLRLAQGERRARNRELADQLANDLRAGKVADRASGREGP